MNATSVYKRDSRNNLTNLDSTLHNIRVARFMDIVDGLTRQVKTDAQEIHSMNNKMNELRTAYQKYRELAEQIKAKDERTRIAVGLISAVHHDDPAEDYDRDEKLAKLCEDAGIPVTEILQAEAWKAPLWKIVREIVRQTPEIQIVELENALRELGVKTSRQAIESAIETHRKEFKIVKRGRDKFISLKGA